MHEKQRLAFEQYSTAFPVKTVKQWEADIEAWEKNPFRRGPDPFEQPVIGMSLLRTLGDDH